MQAELLEKCRVLDGDWVHVTDAIKLYGKDDGPEPYYFFKRFKASHPSTQKLIRNQNRFEFMQAKNVLAVLATMDNAAGQRALMELQQEEKKRHKKKQAVPKVKKEKKPIEAGDEDYDPKEQEEKDEEEEEEEQKPRRKRRFEGCKEPGCDKWRQSGFGGYCREHYALYDEQSKAAAADETRPKRRTKRMKRMKKIRFTVPKPKLPAAFEEWEKAQQAKTSEQKHAHEAAERAKQRLAAAQQKIATAPSVRFYVPANGEEEEGSAHG
jgi:hypothetical protein